MAGTGIATRLSQSAVKPLISTNNGEARRRVLKLYKAWFRQVPFVIHEYDIEINEQQAKAKLREEFRKNQHVTDMRVIDMLVIKGQMELVETANIWKQKNHVMNYFKLTEPKISNDFLTKFYEGHNR